MQIITNIKYLLFELFKSPIIQRKQPYSVIDKHIKPAVDALNNIEGVETIASCHGHLMGHIDSPYVYFKAPIEIATYLHTHIWNATKDFEIYWEITGKYNCECELRFSLRSPPLEYAYHYPFLRLWLYGYRRRELEQSLFRLAQEIKIATKILNNQVNSEDG
ncbi:hypothetical protein ACPV3S_12900 [Photobacterium damselae]|uniref:hypothetical protein n=1 Tax=Photobacterium damselae TaxID=38293 RepID=UPI0040693ADA